ncbi:ABC transporter permease [Pantoea agglomerans]|uniref:ABC transporter permease n=1 Tax=Pantoea TaxID=53335 RepID=UPI001F2D6CB7|nr:MULTISPECIES: ABC transporter permease [Pantoea]UIL51491.1 ABC transporter permease [Pantoea agglomerans]
MTHRYSVRRWYEMVLVLLHKEMQVRYRGSLLGYVWSVAHPLTFGLIYWVVFGKVMRVPVAEYPLFLLSGLFPWQWMAASLGNAPDAFLANSAIIRKTAFPRGVLPFSQVLMEGVHFLCALPVLTGFLLWYGHQPALCWLWAIPLLFLLQLLLLTGITLLLASLTPFLRDLERFVQLGIMMLMYSTPIIWAPDMLPLRWQWLLNLNPAAPLVMAWRELLLDNQVTLSRFPVMALMVLLSLLAGSQVLRRLAPRLAEVL